MPQYLMRAFRSVKKIGKQFEALQRRLSPPPVDSLVLLATYGIVHLGGLKCSDSPEVSSLRAIAIFYF